MNAQPKVHVHVVVATHVSQHVPPRVKQAAHTATHRPSKDDPHREDWDRAARFAWHLSMIMMAIVMISFTDRYMDAAMSAIMTDKVPEGITELIDYIKKL